MRKVSILGRPATVGHVLALNAVTLGLVTVLALGVASVGAVSPNAFQGAGSFRMASATRTTSVLVEGGDGPTAVLSVTFDVPPGKRADLLAFYNGQLTKATTSTVGLCFGSIHLDSPSGAELLPGEQLLLDGGVAASGGAVHGEAASMQARKNGILPGTHELFFVATTGGVGCRYGNNALFAVANLRNV
jgi:hypothetical protein